MMWLNGELVERGAVAASGAGALSGWGVFTTVGVRAGEPRFVARHLARLERDARAAAVTFEPSFAAIERGLSAVLAANQLRNGLARLTLLQRGDGRWNTDSGVDFSILTTETSPSNHGLRVQLSPDRIEARRPLCGVKTTSYLPYLWAWRQAKKQGFDEAILRDGHDFLCEAARSSLFWVQKEVIYTPSLETGCLAGIGRQLGLEWAQSNGLEVRQGSFEVKAAECAAEIWLVSAATGPRQVASWHDETGVIRANFGEVGAGCENFKQWFETQTV